MKRKKSKVEAKSIDEVGSKVEAKSIDAKKAEDIIAQSEHESASSVDQGLASWEKQKLALMNLREGESKVFII